MPAREEYGAQPPIELLRLCTDSLEYVPIPSNPTSEEGSYLSLIDCVSLIRALLDRYYRAAGGIWDKKKLWNDVVDTVLQPPHPHTQPIAHMQVLTRRSLSLEE